MRLIRCDQQQLRQRGDTATPPHTRTPPTTHPRTPAATHVLLSPVEADQEEGNTKVLESHPVSNVLHPGLHQRQVEHGGVGL